MNNAGEQSGISIGEREIQLMYCGCAREGFVRTCHLSPRGPVLPCSLTISDNSSAWSTRNDGLSAGAERGRLCHRTGAPQQRDCRLALLWVVQERSALEAVDIRAARSWKRWPASLELSPSPCVSKLTELTPTHRLPRSCSDDFCTELRAIVVSK